ncbi:thrombospondin type 3 repeat-containing protein [Vibrio sp. CAU 1672]|uniref:thrombospondin type 3 repeat-containing protein n=1 Tax=Vibrio sp. CAU 1672 TaxID=3032594 RepID=UPI0023DA8805|nr:thrombospondin type 3 repeat-containing protein [Vibrio sp. CAU 1672]MDF2154551.1 thrombospondin type 3 repeat-containing protein [Vibrio sp. CAU 1672]
MKKTQIALAIGVAGTSLLSGCGGDSSSDNKLSAQTTYSVKAIDGYLRNATVWLDLDNDYQLDSNEPRAISGVGGVANLNVEGIDDPGKYNVVVQVTTESVDEDTITDEMPEGEPVPVPYVMSAPAGATAVTPLTTKVNLVLEKKKAEAQTDSEDVLSDEQLEALKEAAVQEVAGDLLDPELIMGDYVEDKANNSKAARLAYEAKVLVESNQLPETPSELNEAVKSIAENKTSFDLLEALEAVSEQTQKSIDTVIKNSASDNAAANVDFNELSVPEFVTSKSQFMADDDSDGIPNALDAFPNDGNEWKDTDRDGIGNNTDTDDDGDGIADEYDAFPLNAKESADTDQDGIGNKADKDDDNDGVKDALDAFPLNPNESSDNDKDGIGDNADNDDDNDGILDADDPNPLKSHESADYDRDGIPDVEDNDDDNDGVVDEEDAFPFDSDESVDTDKDGLGDNQDDDDDNDQFPDEKDAFPTNPDEYLDSDGDGIGNNADEDDDNDGVTDPRDYFPLDPSESKDTDGDGIGDNSDPEDDSKDSDDGVDDNSDPDDSNNDNEEETTPVAPTALEFIRGSDVLYELHTDDEYDEATGNHQKFLFVGPVKIQDNKAVTQSPLMVNPDGSLTTVEEEHEDVILTASGWVQTTSYTLDVTSDTPVAYPTNAPESKLSLALELLDLEGKLISEETLPFWSDYLTDTAQFPPGSYAVKFTPKASQDIYSLWTDSEVHVSTTVEPYHAPATSLEQLIAPAATDTSAGQSYPNLVYFGWNIGVELVEGGTANYYMTGNELVKVGSGSWSRNVISGEDIIEFTVPETVIAEFGDKWDQDSSTLICSLYDDGNGSYVRMGSVEREGTSLDESLYLFSETAKLAFLEQVAFTGGNDGSEQDNGDKPTDGTDPGDSSDGTDSGDTSNGDHEADHDEDRSDIADGVGIVTEATNTDIIQFVENTTALNEFDREGEDGVDLLTVDQFVVNGSLAVSSGFKVILPDGTLGSSVEDHEQMVLTDGGWVTPAGYTLDISGSSAIAYPSGYSELVYSLGVPKIIDLANVTLSEQTLPFWSAYKTGSAVFPSGSKALQFAPVAEQDIYSLWTDAEVHVRVVGATSSPYHIVATTLEDLKSAQAATEPYQAKLVYIGWDIGVELVEGGVANFYLGEQLVDSTNWTQGVKGGIDVIEFTVTDKAISAFGEKWSDSPASVLLAAQNGYVMRGAIETANQANDFVVTMFNDTAYQTILAEVEIQCEFAPGEGGSVEDFFEKVSLYQACSNHSLPDISTASLAGNAFSHISDKGNDSSTFFFEDGTLLNTHVFSDETDQQMSEKTAGSWAIKQQDELSYLELNAADAPESHTLLVLLKHEGETSTFATYSPESFAADGQYRSSRSDVISLNSATFSGNLTECLDNAVNTSQAEYDALANECRAGSNITTTYSDMALAGTSWVFGQLAVQTNETGSQTIKAFVAKDEITLNADNTGLGFSLNNPDETFSFSWKVNEAGQLMVQPDDEFTTGTFTITGAEGDYTTQLAYWQEGDATEGNVHSFTLLRK